MEEVRELVDGGGDVGCVGCVACGEVEDDAVWVAEVVESDVGGEGVDLAWG